MRFEWELAGVDSWDAVERLKALAFEVEECEREMFGQAYRGLLDEEAAWEHFPTRPTRLAVYRGGRHIVAVAATGPAGGRLVFEGRTVTFEASVAGEPGGSPMLEVMLAEFGRHLKPALYHGQAAANLAAIAGESMRSPAVAALALERAREGALVRLAAMHWAARQVMTSPYDQVARVHKARALWRAWPPEARRALAAACLSDYEPKQAEEVFAACLFGRQ